MSEIIIKKQDLDKAKLAVTLTSVIFKGTADYIERSGDKPSLLRFLKEFNSRENISDYDKKAICKLEHISKDDLENIFFLASSDDLKVHGFENLELPKEFAMLKKRWRCPIGSGICVFFNTKTNNLYLVHDGASDSEFSNVIDIALCGKQDLEKNNVDISDIPKARYGDELFGEICDFDPNRSREIDNITLDNFLNYDPVNYFIKRFGLVDKSSSNAQEDLKLLFKFFESNGISKTSIDNYMTEKLLINMLIMIGLQPIKITRIGFSLGGNKAPINHLLSTVNQHLQKNCNEKGKCEYECITVNGLELSNVQKNYFKGQLGENKMNILADNILKVKGTKDWVSSIETGVSANTIFFETDKNATGLFDIHESENLRIDKAPVKQGNFHKFFSLVFEGLKKYIDNNPKNNRAYNVVHAWLNYLFCSETLKKNKIKLKKIDLIIGFFVILKSVVSGCFKFVGIKIKDFFVFILSRRNNKQEIKIIDTPKKEKSKEENHNKENKEIDTPKEELKIPKMKNVVNEANKAIG